MAVPKILRPGSRSWWLVAAGALLLTALAACGGLRSHRSRRFSPPVRPRPAPPQSVVISIDGLRPDALAPEDSNIWPCGPRLHLRGSDDLPPPRCQAASMLTGVEPSAHRVVRRVRDVRAHAAYRIRAGAPRWKTHADGGQGQFRRLATGTLDGFVLATVATPTW
jgi:hypothetical protein